MTSCGVSVRIWAHWLLIGLHFTIKRPMVISKRYNCCYNKHILALASRHLGRQQQIYNLTNWKCVCLLLYCYICNINMLHDVHTKYNVITFKTKGNFGCICLWLSETNDQFVFYWKTKKTWAIVKGACFINNASL